MGGKEEGRVRVRFRVDGWRGEGGDEGERVPL